jgi:hypothetical protein
MNKVTTPILSVLLLSSCSLFAPEPYPEPTRAFSLQILNEFNQRPVYGVSILPSNYAIGAHEGIYLADIGLMMVQSRDISQQSSQFKRVGTTNYALAEQKRVISREDSESNWSIVAETTARYDAFEILPSGRVVVGVEGGVQYKDPVSSVWVDVPIPIPGGITPMRINSFLQASNGTLFAGTHDGVYRSKDSAESWQKVTQSIRKEEDDFHHLFEEIDGTILAVYRFKHHASSDNGETWTARSLPSYGGAIFRDGDLEYAEISGDIYFRKVGEIDFKKTGLLKHIYGVTNSYASYIKFIDIRRNQLLIHTGNNQVMIATPNPDWEGWEN